jgi:flagellin-specific chaperone FliS
MSQTYAADRRLESGPRDRTRTGPATALHGQLLAALEGAAREIGAGDPERRSASLGRAALVLRELRGCLDREPDGDAARSLAALYACFALEVMNVGRTMDPGVLARLVAMVGELHGPWMAALEAREVPARGERDRVRGSGGSRAVAGRRTDTQEQERVAYMTIDHAAAFDGARITGTEHASMQAGAAGSTRIPLDPVRTAEIRERILAGAYNSPDVVAQVARRMLASGDI